ncbi:helix-turn-helix domain-containing protein [Marivirga lumbricoides]
MLLIKELMKEKGISGKDLSQKMDITENSLSLIINGKRQPRYETLIQIADILQVDIRDLFKPTKTNEEATDLYAKNSAGEFVKVGAINSKLID